MKASLLKTIRRLGLAGVVLATTATAVCAETVSLDQAVRIALDRSPTLEAARSREQAAEDNRSEARAGFLPKASAAYGYTHLTDDPYINVAGHQNVINYTDQHHWEVRLTQALFTGFSVSAQYARAALLRDIRQLELEAAKMDVVQRVRTAYFKMLGAEKAEAVARSAVAHLEAHAADAQSYFIQGLIPHNDVLKARVALADARQNLQRSSAAVALARADLNLLLERPMESALQPVEIDLQPSDMAETLEQLTRLAVSQRPELKAMQTAMQAAEEQIRQARSSYYPKVALIGKYERNGAELGVQENDFSNIENTSVAIQATWEFFDAGRTRAQVAAAGHARQALEGDRRQLQNKVLLETQKAYQDLMVAQHNIATAAAAREQARENWRVTNRRFAAQLATTTDVLDARRDLTQMESAYFSAFYNLYIARADLDRAVGMPWQPE